MFDGDDNEVAMGVQADLYYVYGISRIHEVVSRRARKPEGSGRNVASLTARLNERSQTFDHRSLQWVHTLVAAQFRCCFAEYLEHKPWESERQHQLRIAAAWSRFIEDEMSILAANEEYLRAHWDSVEFDGTPIGSDAVRRLLRVLLKRYREIGSFWKEAHPDWPT